MIDLNDLVAQKGVGPRKGQPIPQHNAWGYKPAVSMSDDLRRVLNLPRRALELDGTERSQAIIDMITERYGRGPDYKCRCAEIDPDRHRDDGCFTTPRLVQALALREIGICGGLFAPIGVGHGKTFLDLLAPLAFQQVGIHRSALLIPASLIGQLANDYEYIGQHFKMPQIIFHGINYNNTLQKMDPKVPLERGAPEVHVVKYSILSRPESTDWLEKHLKPQAFIADECHRLRDVKRAGAGRVDRYMEDHPDTKFAGWSGSMTSKSLEDYDHIAGWALRGGSPLPREKDVTKDWCRALNPGDDPADPGPLLQFCNSDETLMNGFRRRICETIGVVTTSAPSVDCELRITERPAPPLPDSVNDALRMVRGQKPGQDGPQRPDGEELVDSLAINRVAVQVACGFYYKWIYPKCEFPRDNDLVTVWLEMRALFRREVRAKLKNPEEHLDSPRLILNAAERFHGLRPKTKGLPEWNSKYLLNWLRVKNTVYYEKQTVRIDKFLAQDTANWAHEQPGVVWYDQGAFGEWVAELSGFPIFGGGKAAKLALLGDAKKGIVGEDGSRSVILSIDALGTGTNGLQRKFARAHLANPMASPDGWEQTLGRLHRIGQKAAGVDNFFYRHTPELKKLVDNALRAALYVDGTLNPGQKIVSAMRLD